MLLDVRHGLGVEEVLQGFFRRHIFGVLRFLGHEGNPMDDMNLVALVEQFADEGKARSYLEALRWPDGASCPRCQSTKVYRVQEREQYDCDGCRYQFSVTAG